MTQLVKSLLNNLQAYDITMLQPAPSLKICKNIYHPTDLTVLAFFAGLSKKLMGALLGRHLQLTTDDAMA